MKPEQLRVVEGILKGDVFAVLPTGFGKSACYQCLPLLYDALSPDADPSIILVVTPLTAIMKDQVSRYLANNVMGVCIDIVGSISGKSRVESMLYCWRARG